jgi:hypothetical protein
MRTFSPQDAVKMCPTREIHKLQTKFHGFDDEGVLCRIASCTKHNTEHIASRSLSVYPRTDLGGDTDLSTKRVA